MYEVIAVPGAKPASVPARKSLAETRQAPKAKEHAANGNIGDSLESITIPAAPRLGSEVITVSGVSKGYEGRGLLIEGLDCIIPAGAVVGIVGANGAGKVPPTLPANPAMQDTPTLTIALGHSLNFTLTLILTRTHTRPRSCVRCKGSFRWPPGR